MDTKLLVGLVAVIALAVIGSFFAPHSSVPTSVSQSAILPYGNATLTLGEIAQFKHISIRPIEIVEDSRCPVDVQCIQAGTVRIKVEVVSSMGTSTSIVKLGEVLTTEAERITFEAVAPEKSSKTHVELADYRLTFTGVPQTDMY